MTTNQIFLGVDLGAESGRVMAGLFDGTKITLEELHRFPNGPVSIGGTLRWDVLRLWSEIKKGLSVAGQRFGKDIVSVGVDTWGVDYVLFSKNFEILSQPYHYRDGRTLGMLDYAFNKVSRAEIFGYTGLQFMELNTLYQLLAFQRSHPDVLSAAGCILLMPDFFHWCLSGSKVCEFTDATTSQCLNPLEKTWAYDMLEKFGLPTDIFPDVVPPGSELGTLLQSVSDETGLGKINVVAPATHDTGSAVAAVPALHTGKPNWAYISSGTWSLAGVEIQEAVLSPATLDMNFTNEGGVDGTYRLLKNIMGLWLVQQCRRAFEKRGKTLGYDELAKMAEAVPAFRSIVNPDDQRFLNPPDMTVAIQDYCRETGQPAPETEGQFVRCALESLALKYDQVMQSIKKLTGTEVDVIHIVGGGCQNRLLNQLTANACGKPVMAGPVEATVLGNLLVQARTSGSLTTLKDIREVVQNSTAMDTFEPQGQNEWQDAKGRFAKLTNQ